MLLAVVASGCGGMEIPLAVPTTAELPPPRGPELTAERVDSVLAASTELCAEPGACEEPTGLSGMLWSYPDLTLPYSIWRFPTSDQQEVISIGITSLFDPGDPRSTDVERGNTLYYPFNEDP